MKQFLSFMAVVFAIIITGCGKHDSNPISSELHNLTIDSVSGSIHNWTLGSSKLIKFGAFGTSSIDETGAFEIKSLAIPNGSRLQDFAAYFENSTQLPDISDDSVKYCLVSNLEVVNAYSPDNVIGYVQKWGSTNPVWTAGNYITYYIYFDKTITINGIYAYSINGGNIKEVFKNITFEKGWNKFVLVEDTADNKTNTRTFEVSGQEPTDGIWIYIVSSRK